MLAVKAKRPKDAERVVNFHCEIKVAIQFEFFGGFIVHIVLYQALAEVYSPLYFMHRFCTFFFNPYLQNPLDTLAFT